MKRVIAVAALAAVSYPSPAAGLPVAAPESQGVSPLMAERLDSAIRAAIHQGRAVGAVCVVGHNGHIVYRKAFGYAQTVPVKRLMTEDTLFDLASLTKCVATATSVMTLVEQGKLSLQTQVASVWPEFGRSGKGEVTVRQLLTHTGGLPAGHGFFAKYAAVNRDSWPTKADWKDLSQPVLDELAATTLRYRPDTRMVYSDDGFITLGEVVRRVSGEPLDVYARRTLYGPLRMKDTTFNPGPNLRRRAETTEQRYGRWLQGEVHDPNAWTLGGVAGHAGLFSTADDLARFAQMLLNGGELDGVRVLSPATVRAMTSPASPEGLDARGLGWDIDAAPRRGDLFSFNGFGHTGWTGTSLWVDPASRTFIVLLTNRCHPNGRGEVGALQRRVSTIVAASINDLPQSARTAAFAPPRPPMPPADTPGTPPFAVVQTGIDVLEQEGFAALKGRRVGLITNPTGINRKRISTGDLLYEQHQKGTLTLVAFFGPEHGIRSDKDDIIRDEKDPKTGLPIHSLYDYQRGIFKPTPEMLKGIDTIVFDVQDIGVRYYTYITTMAYAMESAKEAGIRMVVLDRPNPINGVVVDGPMLNLEKRGFASYAPTPVRHGMTVGELARYFNDALNIGCDLEVVPCRNWRRAMWFDQTGLPWVNPSPNIRSLKEATLYAAIGMTEAAEISVGRGTDRPFELLGAPYADDVQLAEELNRLRLPGLGFIPHQFTPATREYRNTVCKGVGIELLDRDALQGTRTAVSILDTLRRLYGNDRVKVEGCKGLFGSKAVTDAILAGKPAQEIAASWQKDVDDFRRARTKYLLYD